MLEPKWKTRGLDATEIALKVAALSVEVRAAADHEDTRFKKFRRQIVFRKR